MMTESGFLAFSGHLQELLPIFDKFCAQYGFDYVAKTAIGRYPRIRIIRSGVIELHFDLWMQLDKHGKRFEEFKRDLPYDLGAGACLLENDGSKHGVRYQKSFLCFFGKPFHEVGAILQSEMEKHLHTLEAWDTQYLKDEGEKVQLGG